MNIYSQDLENKIWTFHIRKLQMTTLMRFYIQMMQEVVNKIMAVGKILRVDNKQGHHQLVPQRCIQIIDIYNSFL